MSLIPSLADAITRQEGPTQNNNPGNLWDAPHRIWPQYPTDSRGFVIFPTPEAGRAELERQLAIKIGRGETLTQILNAWAPASDPRNDPATYIANVSNWTGLPVDVPLNTLGGGADSQAQGDGSTWTAKTAGSDTNGGGFDVSPVFEDFGPVGAPWLMEGSQAGQLSKGALLGLVALGLALWWYFSD